MTRSFFIFLCLLHFSIYSQNYKTIKVTYKLLSENMEIESTMDKYTQELFKKTNEINSNNHRYYEMIATSKGFTFREIAKELPMDLDEREKSVIKISNQMFGLKDVDYNMVADSLFVIKGDYRVYTERDRTWKMNEQEKKINNFTCYYAEGTESIINRNGEKKSLVTEVWFCPELIFSYAPDGPVDLPGLVLEYKQGRKKVVARKVEFIEEELPLENWTNLREITDKKYKEAAQIFMGKN